MYARSNTDSYDWTKTFWTCVLRSGHVERMVLKVDREEVILAMWVPSLFGQIAVVTVIRIPTMKTCVAGACNYILYTLYLSLSNRPERRWATFLIQLFHFLMNPMLCAACVGPCIRMIAFLDSCYTKEWTALPPFKSVFMWITVPFT